MRLSWNEIRARAARFAEEWKDACYERGETQTFYNELFSVFGVSRRRVASFEESVKKLGDERGFIDLFWKGARQAGVQGTVVLNAVVNAEGAVTQVKFVSGPEDLSLAAIDAVRWWRYEPYLVNGQPATVETTVNVDFRLAN